MTSCRGFDRYSVRGGHRPISDDDRVPGIRNKWLQAQNRKTKNVCGVRALKLVLRSGGPYRTKNALCGGYVPPVEGKVSDPNSSVHQAQMHRCSRNKPKSNPGAPPQNDSGSITNALSSMLLAVVETTYAPRRSVGAHSLLPLGS